MREKVLGREFAVREGTDHGLSVSRPHEIDAVVRKVLDPVHVSG